MWTSILQTLNVHGIDNDLDRLLTLTGGKLLFALEPFTTFSIIFGRIPYLTYNPEIIFPASAGVAHPDFLASTPGDVSMKAFARLLCPRRSMLAELQEEPDGFWHDVLEDHRLVLAGDLMVWL
ncbi:hypothetical protein BC629DRAFT_1595564 [Irpex lacteus]|nr:hypothetical protein BC629DRAFT_1595564 [Irpex lacteus]